MSKKSRKNSSKPAERKVSKGASKGASKAAPKPAAKTAAKTATKSAAKPATKTAAKRPAKAVAAKPAKLTVAKATVAKTAAKGTGKPAKAAPVKKPAAAAAKKPVAAAATGIATEGGIAPAFQLPRDGGAQVSLADYAGQKLVLVFYPRASTPGCTKEAIDFTRLSADFAAAGTAVLGVSADPVKTQESFRNKYDLGIPLLSDGTQAMLKSYGAWGEKSMYGKIFEGVLRTTVLIDAEGRVARIWRGVKVDGHADAVLEAARGI